MSDLPDCASDSDEDSPNDAEQEDDEQDEQEDEYLSSEDSGAMSMHNGVTEETSSVTANGYSILDVPEMKRMQVRVVSFIK